MIKKLVVQPVSKLKGSFSVQGDKSISHRAIMLAALSQGETEITNFLSAEDCLNTVQCFKEMGVKITPNKITNSTKKIHVQGVGLDGLKLPEKELYAGNSGTTIRLLTGILAAQKFNTVINGDASIQKRPMARIVKPLQEMGAQISGEYAPLKIFGQALKPIHYHTPMASAQVKSCILLAGLFCDGITSVTEPAASRDHTERMLEYLGANITRQGLTVSIEGRPLIEAKPIFVPGDISSAAFLIVTGLILNKAEIVVQNVGINPTRTGILEVLRKMGGDIVLEKEREMNGEPVADIRVVSSALNGITVEGTMIPRMIDEIPILAVAAACAKGTTVIKDAKELRVKESDRIQSMVSELKKFGVKIFARDDGMLIEGGGHLHAAECESHGDHRVAMACAIAGLAVTGNDKTIINNVDCIKTSFPGFLDFIKAWRG
ncbi:MAG: 3-phosphoshikimate 1-carboxyvinyltransferase [Candidatus Margulisbacteria bacterium]|nr:3-phosphoshikimate 1-carboxyvinyltransferase [Candidatus Margulisiibacteriota bacterium]